MILLIGHPAGARVKLDSDSQLANVASRRRLALMPEVRPLDRSATWPYHAKKPANVLVEGVAAKAGKAVFFFRSDLILPGG
jgi:hypothetical protein